MRRNGNEENRRAGAVERAEERAKRSTKEQMRFLDARGVVAVKERRRLRKLLRAGK